MPLDAINMNVGAPPTTDAWPRKKDEDAATLPALREKKRETDKSSATGKKTTPEQDRQLAELKARDLEVRQHEAAHAAAGGALAGAPTYSYQVGPDGQRYAVGGEVNIDVSPEKDPRATITKMQRVKAAALAPAKPSGSDLAVARSADAQQQKAQQELQKVQSGGGQPTGKIVNIKA